MKKLDTLTNSELINYVYIEIAGQFIRERMVDWSDYKKWWLLVNSMANPVKLVYRIGILNQQIMNGGLIQYFDNSYGIHALETLKDLRMIEAHLSANILEKALEIINPLNYKGIRFIKFIAEQEYDSNYDIICENLKELDYEYYHLDSKEDFENIVGNYLKQRINEIK